MKYLFPLINIAIAGALFFMVTDKMIVNAPLNENRQDVTKSSGGIRALLAEQEKLNKAIGVANEVSRKVNSLNEVYNSFAPSDLARLDQLLPDHVDNIQLIIDVNGIAKRNGMTIKNVKAQAEGMDSEKTGNTQTASISSFDARLGTVLLSFSVTGTYDAYKKFLADLARSLRIIDISSSAFGTDDKGVYTYNVELRTYWLK